MALEWQEIGEGRFEARTAGGATYTVDDVGRQGSSGFSAFYRPPPGRAHPKERIPLGKKHSMAEARALCERHYTERPPPRWPRKRR